MTDEKNLKLSELADRFNEPGTPEERMEIHRKSIERSNEIASSFVHVLINEGLTVNEAISILKSAESQIMQSRFTNKP